MVKKYSELTIDEKINFKANQLAHGKKYGNLPKGWKPMLMPLIIQDIRACYNYSQLDKG